MYKRKGETQFMCTLNLMVRKLADEYRGIGCGQIRIIKEKTHRTRKIVFIYMIVYLTRDYDKKKHTRTRICRWDVFKQ